MSPKEVCLECGMEVPQVDIRSHVDSCKKLVNSKISFGIYIDIDEFQG